MYAVIRTGGKQYRVEQGERLEVELVGADDGAEIELAARPARRRRHRPGHTQRARGRRGEGQGRRRATGPKIDGFVYKPKSNNRRRYGHRQDYSVLEITAINPARKQAEGTGPMSKKKGAPPPATGATPTRSGSA